MKARRDASEPHSRDVVRLLTILLLLILAGCSTVPPGFIKKQSIHYKRTDVLRVTPERVDANLVFLEINRDSVTLDNVTIDYELYLEGERAASGKDVRLNLPANDTTEYIVPITIRWLDFFKTAENMRKAILAGKKTVRFTAKTLVTIHVKLLGSFSIPVAAEDELPLPEVQLPKLKLKF
jgi:hypothetical protein